MFSFGLIVVLLLVLCSEFVNGWTDSPNAIATVVSTRVLKPRWAVVLATVCNTIGAFLGTEVAETIGKGIVNISAVTLVTVGAAMTGIVIWSVTAWYFGLPTSESHGLVAGLAGAGLATAGPSVLLWSGWEKVLIGLAFSSLIGLGGGFGIAWLIRNSLDWIPRARGKADLHPSADALRRGHGLEPRQQRRAEIHRHVHLALMLGGVLGEFRIQPWTVILCSLVMGIGTSIGGWRIIKTMGQKMVRLEPYQGFRRGERRLGGDPPGLGPRHPPEHDAHHQHLDHGRGRGDPALGHPLGRGPGNGDRLDPDLPHLRGDRVSRSLVFKHIF